MLDVYKYQDFGRSGWYSRGSCYYPEGLREAEGNGLYRKLMQCNEENCKDLHLVRNSHRQQLMMEVTQLESTLVENGLGVLTDTRLNMNQQYVLAAKKAIVILDCIRRLRRFQQVEGGDPSPPFSTNEATLEELCPILGFPLQKEDGNTGETPTKGLRDDSGTEASLL